MHYWVHWFLPVKYFTGKNCLDWDIFHYFNFFTKYIALLSLIVKKWSLHVSYNMKNIALSFYSILYDIFSSPDPGELLSPLVVRPSVNFSHFNQLLWSHWANLNQTLVEWSLDGPLPKLYPVIPTSNQDGRQAKNRKRGNGILIVHCCFIISQNELKF